MKTNRLRLLLAAGLTLAAASLWLTRTMTFDNRMTMPRGGGAARDARQDGQDKAPARDATAAVVSSDPQRSADALRSRLLVLSEAVGREDRVKDLPPLLAQIHEICENAPASEIPAILELLDSLEDPRLYCPLAIALGLRSDGAAKLALSERLLTEKDKFILDALREAVYVTPLAAAEIREWAESAGKSVEACRAELWQEIIVRSLPEELLPPDPEMKPENVRWTWNAKQNIWHLDFSYPKRKTYLPLINAGYLGLLQGRRLDPTLRQNVLKFALRVDAPTTPRAYALYDFDLNNEEGVTTLLRLLEVDAGNEDMVRVAASRLNETGEDSRITKALCLLVTTCPDPGTVQNAVCALEGRAGADVLDALSHAATRWGDQRDIRYLAIRELVSLDDPRGEALVQQMLDAHSYHDVREAFVSGLHAKADFVDPLRFVPFARDENQSIRDAALAALAETDRTEADAILADLEREEAERIASAPVRQDPYADYPDLKAWHGDPGPPARPIRDALYRRRAGLPDSVIRRGTVPRQPVPR